MASYNCPICGVGLKPNPRYPRYVCTDCYNRAASEDGRPLSFGNIGMSGGYTACYTDTGEDYDSHVCFIDGVQCYADEARFGGIVIEKV